MRASPRAQNRLARNRPTVALATPSVLPCVCARGLRPSPPRHHIFVLCYSSGSRAPASSRPALRARARAPPLRRSVGRVVLRYPHRGRQRRLRCALRPQARTPPPRGLTALTLRLTGGSRGHRSMTDSAALAAAPLARSAPPPRGTAQLRLLGCVLRPGNLKSVAFCPAAPQGEWARRRAAAGRAGTAACGDSAGTADDGLPLGPAVRPAVRLTAGRVGRSLAETDRVHFAPRLKLPHACMANELRAAGQTLPATRELTRSRSNSTDRGAARRGLQLGRRWASMLSRAGADPSWASAPLRDAGCVR